MNRKRGKDKQINKLNRFGKYSTKHVRIVENLTAQAEPEPEPEEQICKHNWKCLRDRVHNKGKGKGKYMAYKCTLCNKFQRRKY